MIPSDLGYGDTGAPPDIPGGATLVFEAQHTLHRILDIPGGGTLVFEVQHTLHCTPDIPGGATLVIKVQYTIHITLYPRHTLKHHTCV